MRNRRRPRALSLTLPNSRQPVFVLEKERYLLRNLSESGMGVWIPKEKAFGLTPKTQIKGDIVIDREIHPVTLEVVHSAKGYVGLKILHSDRDLTRTFRDLLEPSNYATDVIPTQRSGREEGENGTTLFEYTSGPLVGFSFTVGRSLDIRSIRVRLLGQFVSRDQFGRASTGSFTELKASLDLEETILMDEVPSNEAITKASQFLASLPPPLPGAKLWHFLESGEQVFVSEELLKQTA